MLPYEYNYIIRGVSFTLLVSKSIVIGSHLRVSSVEAYKVVVEAWKPRASITSEVRGAHTKLVIYNL